MRICVSRKFRNVVENNLYKGMVGYMNLPWYEKNEILMQTFQRAMLFFWLTSGKRSVWSRVKSGAEKDDVTQEVGDTELLSSEIALTSKSKYKEEKKEGAKVAEATARVSCSFDAAKFELHVEVLEISAKDDATHKYYEKLLKKELNDARNDMEFFLGMEEFLRCFFDTLHSKLVTMVTGSEAVHMYHVYNNALKYFPQFKKLNDKTRADVMDQGYRRSRSQRSGSKDIWTFAKGTFEMFASNGLIDEVIKENQITGKLVKHTKIMENRKDRCNPDNPREIWEKNALIFVDYKYGTHQLRTSVLAYDLWSLLARNNNSDGALVNAW